MLEQINWILEEEKAFAEARQKGLLILLDFHKQG